MPFAVKKEIAEASGGMTGRGSSPRSQSLYDAIKSASNIRSNRMQQQGQEPKKELARDIGKNSMYYKGNE